MRDNSKIKNIQFRHKEYDCKQTQFLFETSTANNNETTVSITESALKEPGYINIFMNGFVCNLYLRPSCHKCPVRSSKSGSDITIGDYWGIHNIHPEFDDDRGVSLVLINTEKGRLFYDSLSTDKIATSYYDALRGNPSLENPAAAHRNRNKFFEKFENKNVIHLICQLSRKSLYVRMIYRLCRSNLYNRIKPVLRKTGVLIIIKSLLRKVIV